MSGREAPARCSAHSSIVASDMGTPKANGSPEEGLDSELDREAREAPFSNDEGPTFAGTASGAAAGSEGKTAAGDANAEGPPTIIFFMSTSPLR